MEEINSTEIQEINANGIAFPYIEQGKGTPMVLVHGSLSDYRMWEGQLEAFSQKHRVFSYSRRYAYPGKITADSVGYSVVPHAKDLAAFIKALNIGPVHLVGHSYGAYTALVTALEHPELVKSLCLGEPPVLSFLSNTTEGNGLLSEFKIKTILPAAQAFEKGNDLEGVRIFLDGVMNQHNLYDQLPPEIQQQIQDNIPELKGVVSTHEEAVFSTFITCEDLKKLKVPTLLITGEISTRFLTLISDELEKCLPRKERVIIPGASHEMEMENPPAFNEAVLRFIQKYE